MNEVDNIAF